MDSLSLEKFIRYALRPQKRGKTRALRDESYADAIQHHLGRYGYALSQNLRYFAHTGDGWLLDGSDLYLSQTSLASHGFTKHATEIELPLSLIDRPKAVKAGKLSTPLSVLLACIRHFPDVSPSVLASTVCSIASIEQTGVDELLSLTKQTQSLDRKLTRQPHLGKHLPALPVTPDTLTIWGLPPIAVSWMADRYGWNKGDNATTKGPLLPFQTMCISRGIVGPLLTQSGILAAPTSAGKTMLAEARMLARYFKERGRRKTVMLVPTREVGLERFRDIMAAYGVGERTRNPKRRLHVCYSDGEHHADDRNIWEGRFDVAILINEKLRFFQQNKRFLNGVGEIVFDELDVMGDSSRGTYLEMAFTSATQTHKELTLLGLSRPARNFDALLASMRSLGGKAFTMETSLRPIPIEVGIWCPQEGVARFRNCNTHAVTSSPQDLGYPNKKKSLETLLLHYVKQSEQERNAGLRNNIVIAAPTKRANLELAGIMERLYYESGDVQDIINDNASTSLIPERLKGLEPTQRKGLLERLLPLGIGVHDADLTAEERNVVSTAFRAGELPILFCTQTFAYGVNLPAQTIVFFDWGLAPGLHSLRDFPPYYHRLAEYFETWLGRVGRWGQPSHRKATALYLSRGNPGSEEYETVRDLIASEKHHLQTHLERTASLDASVLYAIRSLRHALSEYPKPMHLEAFFQATPSAFSRRWPIEQSVLRSIRRQGGFEFPSAFYRLYFALDKAVNEGRPVPEEAYEMMVGELKRLGIEQASFLSLVEMARHGDLEPLWSFLNATDFAWQLIRPEERDGHIPGVVLTEDGRLELTPLGAIACAHGVELETCTHLRKWLEEHRRPTGWSIMDLLMLLRETVDGSHIPLLRSFQGVKRKVEADFESYMALLSRRLGASWTHRTKLFDANYVKGYQRKATLLALKDWVRGVPLVEQEGGIETRYGLFLHGSSLYKHARDYARLFRVLSDIVTTFPETTFPEKRPEDIPGIVVPHDLDELAAQMLYGMPYAASDLATLSIPGLTRTWVLRLYDKVESLNLEPNLPLLERVRLLAAEPGSLQDVLPTPGLAARIEESIEENPRLALATSLRGRSDFVKSFYGHPLIQQAHVLQGRDRYTALRVSHRRIYTVFRRNRVKGSPIVLETVKDVEEWVGRGAVAFLAEIGQERDSDFMVDRLFVDLDPANDYPMDALVELTVELTRRFKAHRWVDASRTFIHWSGNRGPHVVGHLKEGAFRSIESAKHETQLVLRSVSNDVSIFLKDHRSVLDPYVVLDLSPVKARGVYRNAFSLNANTGYVCLPVSEDEFRSFDPEKDCTTERVQEVLNGSSSYLHTYLGLLESKH